MMTVGFKVELRSRKIVNSAFSITFLKQGFVLCSLNEGFKGFTVDKV